MSKVLGHLKKHVFTILFVVVLLFIQAMCDLALPDYTSKIVDVGIQQNGIEDNVFEEINDDDFDKLLLFLNSSDEEFVKSNYEFLNNKYYLKNISNDDRTRLSIVLLKPEMAISMLNDEVVASMNFKSLDDFYKVLKVMNDEQVNEFNAKMDEKFASIDDSFKMQFGIKYVSNVYEACSTDIGHIQSSYIKSAGFKMLGIALVGAVIAIMVSYLSSRLAAKFSRDLRQSVVAKVMSYSSREFKEVGAASLITRSTNDISRLQMFVTMVLRILIFAPIMGIGALLKVINNSMSFIIVIAVSLILVLVIVLFVVAMPKFKVVQDLIDRVNLVFREILNGLPVIRSFSNEKHEEERFDEANKDLTRVNLFVNRVMTVMMPTMTFIMNFIAILIIWVGSKRIDMGTIQIGTLMAFIQYTMQIIMSFLMISMMSIMIPRAIVSMKRIAEVLNKESSIVDAPIIDEIEFKGNVEFRDVYFRYHDADEDILENISFKAKPGTTTAIIGGTGCGKSTLVNLLPRFFDVTGGQILIDGVDIKKLSLHDLRENIGYVGQQGLLFKGTIESNIAFSDDVPNKDKVVSAARVAQALDFINDKEDKFESAISQGGTNVSGGQKQRLSIARAIYKDPSIYIFDDSFSALDFKTDKNLRNELKKISKDKTVFIVAQRISTVLTADQIIVLDEGKIVGIGRHEDLMKTCDVYKEIALSQVTEEELEHGK